MDDQFSLDDFDNEELKKERDELTEPIPSKDEFEVREEPELSAYVKIPVKILREGDRIHFIIVDDEGEIQTEPTEAVFRGTKGADYAQVLLRGEFPGDEYDGVKDYWTGGNKIEVMKIVNRELDEEEKEEVLS